MNMRFFMVLPFLLVFYPVFAESSEYVGTENSSDYVLQVDDHTYTVPYSVDAKVLAMAIDPELTSLLIGLENTQDSIFVINLEHELIDAENNEFAVLVNGYEVDYDITSDADSSILSFYVPEFTEEVEIIGTHVIPEFPLGVFLGFVMMLSVVTVFARTNNMFRL